MNEQLVSRWNFSGQWNDERIERWLERLAAEGLHLEKVGTSGRYWFRRGAPAHVTYRIDVAEALRQPDVTYLQLLTDAGWRVAAQQGARYYWRNDDPAAPELFTDEASRAAKFRRSARIVEVLFALQFFFGFRVGDRLYHAEPLNWFDKCYLPVWAILTVYLAYAWMRLMRRARRTAAL